MSILRVFVKTGSPVVGRGHRPIGHRERAKKDKPERILTAARERFTGHGVSGVTTQQIAYRADVALGTLYRYACTKAELLIMGQNEKFATAIARCRRSAADGLTRWRPSCR